MKKNLKKIIVLALLTLNAAAQNPKSGIYKTFADYNNNKLAYESDCKTEKESIKLNEFLNESHVTIKRKGEKIKVQKDSIYGILNCDEPLIRIQNKEHFYLAEKGNIWIFYKEISESQNKGFRIVKEYYFSTKGDGKIIELTIDNVKQAFPDNHPLHDAISAQFQTSDISEYDTFHKMFKINHIINSANNINICPTHSEVTGKEGDKCSKCDAKLRQSKK